MIIKKITSGFVVQEFDTDLKQFISQEFIAGDTCDYEDDNGDVADCCLLEVNGEEVYLPFDMEQPK